MSDNVSDDIGRVVGDLLHLPTKVITCLFWSGDTLNHCILSQTLYDISQLVRDVADSA